MKMEDIILAHAKYKVSLRSHIEKGTEIDIPDNDLSFWIRDQECWLSHLPTFQNLCREHEAFHSYVTAVLTLVGEGKRSEAKSLLSEEMFVLISDEIVNILIRLGQEIKKVG
ncbi:MAG: hypothetical protein AAGB31_09505 [Bdellovibrio sp.]